MSEMVIYIIRYWSSINGAMCKRQRSWLGSQRANPPEAETLLAFGRSMEAANLPGF